MAIHRYWRLSGFCTSANGLLELSEARLYEGVTLADTGATLTVSHAPTSGNLGDLRDDLTTGVVSWDHAAFTQPGFAITWDFGSGAGVDAAALRLGSGNSADTFPLDLVCQYSDDGGYWETYQWVVAISYPGVLSLTAAPAPGGSSDTHAASVVLLMIGDTLLDTGPAARTVTALGNTGVSTAQSKYGSTSIYFDGAGDSLTVPSFSIAASGEDFTVEGWLYPTALVSFHQIFYGGASGFQIVLYNGRVWQYGNGGNIVSSPSGVVINQWQHFAVVRASGQLRVYLQGVGGTSIAHTQAYTLSDIGSYTNSSGEFYKGYMQQLRITKGVARYLDNFTPPGSFVSASVFLQVDTILPTRARSVTQPPDLYVGTSLPATTAQGHLRENTFVDAYHGGQGVVSGTVKEKNTPANTPLHRRVVLIDEASRMTIRETWSDPVTGAFEFRGVKQGVKYSMVSYDHLHNYVAVIADNQDAI